MNGQAKFSNNNGSVPTAVTLSSRLSGILTTLDTVESQLDNIQTRLNGPGAPSGIAGTGAATGYPPALDMAQSIEVRLLTVADRLKSVEAQL